MKSTTTRAALSALALVFLSVGCGAQESESEPRTVEQELTQQVGPGEGITERTLPAMGVGNICVDVKKVEVTGPEIHISVVNTPVEEAERRHNVPTHRTFWVTDVTELESRLAQVTRRGDGGGYLAYEGLLGVAQQHFNQIGDGEYFTMLLTIPSADVRVTENGATQDMCDSLGSLASWVTSCGTRFLKEEKRGEYAIATVPASRLIALFEDDVQWSNFVRLSQLEAGTGGVGIATDELMMVLATEYPSLTFDYSNRNGASGTLVPSAWENFKRGTTSKSVAAIQRQDPTDPDLGVKIWEHAPAYAFPDTCAPEIKEAFICYANFHNRARLLRERSVEIETLLKALEGNVYQVPPSKNGDDVADAYRATVQEWVRLVEDGELFEQANQCDAALNIGGDVCGACDTSEINALANELDMHSPALIETPDSGIGQLVQEFNVDQDRGSAVIRFDANAEKNTGVGGKYDHCYLSGLGGKLAGASEGVVIEFEPRQEVFTVSALGNRTSDSEKIYGQMTCTEGIKNSSRAAETLITNTNDWIQINASVTGTDTATALAGVKGKMQGTGERIDVVRASPTSTNLEVKTGTGENLTATVITPGGAPTFFEHVNEDLFRNEVSQTRIVDLVGLVGRRNVETTLMHRSVGYCFLSGVAGKFDGRREYVGIELVNKAWVLKVRSGWTDEKCGSDGFMSGLFHGVCEPKPVEARARCVAY